MQCVNGMYLGKSMQEIRDMLTNQLNALQRANINAIIFQVRPEGDALYKSNYEPWSRYLTGQQGLPPSDGWDPLQWMIEQCHARGMECHAWINPYRMKTKNTTQLAQSHPAIQHPDWVIPYGDLLILNPALEMARLHTCVVVEDILRHYDVDGIHMDDYFYPYPVEGVDFPDTISYNLYGIGWDLGDWRRHNVDLLIEQLHNSIQEVKPWVRFGISPFGIWRNKKSDPDGSDTNGLQCYDGLYADCIKWTAEGWVDYQVPQLYWELEHLRASSLILNHWWNDHANGRHMYFGQAIYNIMSHRDIADEGGDTLNPTQLDHRFRLMRQLPHVQGPCWWPGYNITDNHKGFMDSLVSKHQSTLALIPAYDWLDSTPPAAVTHLKQVKGKKGVKMLTWQPAPTADPMQQAVRYVVYRFHKGEKPNYDNAACIMAITGDTSFTIPKDKGKWIWAVTALDRCWNESQPKSTK